MAVLKRMPCALAAASWSCCGVMARSAASESAPAAAANLTPFCSASASGRGGRLAIAAPLSQIAPAIRFLESGEAISALTEIDPADSPAIVTRFGSPPNAAMFFCTHSQRGHLVEQAVVARGVVRRFPGQLRMRRRSRRCSSGSSPTPRRCPLRAMLSPS